jgi:hypothetical protein
MVIRPTVMCGISRSASRLSASAFLAHVCTSTRRRNTLEIASAKTLQWSQAAKNRDREDLGADRMHASKGETNERANQEPQCHARDHGETDPPVHPHLRLNRLCV